MVCRGLGMPNRGCATIALWLVVGSSTVSPKERYNKTLKNAHF